MKNSELISEYIQKLQGEEFSLLRDWQDKVLLTLIVGGGIGVGIGVLSGVEGYAVTGAVAACAGTVGSVACINKSNERPSETRS